MNTLQCTYDPYFVMHSSDPDSGRRIDIWHFKSSKSHRTYIIEIEFLCDYLFAPKFYCKSMRDSKKRYSLLTNDGEPRTIIYTCLKVVVEYIRRNPLFSFGFIAAEDLDEKKKANKNRRFEVYRRIMAYVFGNETFMHVHDYDNSLYLLISRKALQSCIISLSEIESTINKIYDSEFELSGVV